MVRVLLICGVMGLLGQTACGGEAKRKAAATKAVADHRKSAERCFTEGRYGCAMDGYKKALEKRPDDADLLNRFAVAARLRYYVSGEADFRDQELVALRKAARAAPRQTDVQVNFGTTCWEMGLRKEAAKAYERALALEPGHPDAALMRARIKRSTTEVEEEEEE